MNLILEDETTNAVDVRVLDLTRHNEWQTLFVDASDFLFERDKAVV
jgi:hypothetical protein